MLLADGSPERILRLSFRKGAALKHTIRSGIVVTWVSFGLAASESRANPLAEIARTVEGKARRASSGLFDPESNIDAYHIAPGRTEVLTELQGPGEIRHMWFTLSGRDRRYPRTAVLRIYWDGADVPSVETPIGDFFAAGNGMRANLTSPPVEVTSYGRALNCYWRMPFRRSARIAITNEGQHDLCVYWQFDWMELPKPPEELVYFHARYRQEFPAKPFSPYVIFEGKGSGHYVGTVFSIQCSYGSWFGESDDRFYVDGEAAPSIVGTGTEDYFNDAWNLRLFTNANTGVTIKEPNGEDCRFTAYRWHINAPVTFSTSLKVDIERRSFCRVTDPKTGKVEDYDFKYRPDFCSSVAFWYQRDIAARTEPFPSVQERINKEIVVEVSDMESEIRTGDGTTARRRSNRVCNRKQMLSVDNRGTGGWFEVPCHVQEEGLYSISVYQCLARTGGIWKVTLKGPTGETLLARAMDFYDAYLALKENRPENVLYGTWFEEKVGIHRLVPGDYAMRFECVGANPLSRGRGSEAPGYDCGLDGISLRRFPWDDLHGMMQRYLADEAKLFAARIAEARSTVTKLERGIQGYHADTGEYPRELSDLTTRPQRLAQASGRWPYVTSVVRDPWGQEYCFALPGLFNPDAFDVYSVHGNSRSPGEWIGNWPTPYVWRGAIEAETLRPRQRSPKILVTPQEARPASAPCLSGGRLLFLRMNGPGDAVELLLPEKLDAGPHQMAIRLVTSWDYAIVRLSWNGRPLGAPVDTCTPRLGTTLVQTGEVDVRAGGNVLRIEVVRKNESSTGFFAGIDAIRLAPTPPPR